MHAIRDLTADAYGGWKAVTNVQAGGGLYAQRIVTRKHYDMDRAKAAALDVAGLAEGGTRLVALRAAGFDAEGVEAMLCHPAEALAAMIDAAAAARTKTIRVGTVNRFGQQLVANPDRNYVGSLR